MTDSISTVRRSPIRTAAAVVGAVFLLVGILGFIPGITTDYSDMTFAGHESDAQLLGIFQVSVLHNIVTWSSAYARVLMSRTATGLPVPAVRRIVYLVLWLYGLVTEQTPPRTSSPLNNADDWLHFVLGGHGRTRPDIAARSERPGRPARTISAATLNPSAVGATDDGRARAVPGPAGANDRRSRYSDRIGTGRMMSVMRGSADHGRPSRWGAARSWPSGRDLGWVAHRQGRCAGLRGRGGPPGPPVCPRRRPPPPPWRGTAAPSWWAPGFCPGPTATPRQLRNRRIITLDELPPPPDGGFHATVTAVPEQVLDRSTWSPRCPVDRDDLRYVRVSFQGFDGLAHTGELIVHRRAATTVVRVFRRLFRVGFPIERMRVTSVAELDAPPTGDGNTTAAFVCRPVVGARSWSRHAFGLAVDVNPFQNPYTAGDVVLPELASAYTDRQWRRPGMILAGGPVVEAFEREGWTWGGTFRNRRDPMHFSLGGG